MIISQQIVTVVVSLMVPVITFGIAVLIFARRNVNDLGVYGDI